MKMVDSHIHLDQYSSSARQEIIDYFKTIGGAAIAVSTDQTSSMKSLREATFPIYPAIGWHPEQKLMSEKEQADFLQWASEHIDQAIAIGEVGLPQYLRREDPTLDDQPYLEFLEGWVLVAKRAKKPIVLHAVYDDAPKVLQLLEKHSITHAHFHWFKGDEKTIERIVANDYKLSVTPEVVYREKIQRMLRHVPLSSLMIETDGPWPFEGPFTGQMTHPSMMKKSIETLSKLYRRESKEVAQLLFETTVDFYSLFRHS